MPRQYTTDSYAASHGKNKLDPVQIGCYLLNIKDDNFVVSLRSDGLNSFTFSKNQILGVEDHGTTTINEKDKARKVILELDTDPNLTPPIVVEILRREAVIRRTHVRRKEPSDTGCSCGKQSTTFNSPYFAHCVKNCDDGCGCPDYCGFSNFCNASTFGTHQYECPDTC